MTRVQSAEPRRMRIMEPKAYNDTPPLSTSEWRKINCTRFASRYLRLGNNNSGLEFLVTRIQGRDYVFLANVLAQTYFLDARTPCA